MNTTRTTNQNRADAGSTALSAYLQAKGLDRDPCPLSPDEALIDLLTDLRHYAAASGLDFEAAVRMSEFHFNEESEINGSSTITL